MQPDATALRFLGHTTTWGELDRRVTALAGALSRRGVGFGDRVLILMLNRTEFIESFLAANKLGAIAVPVNFRMTPPEIAFLVGDCEAKVVDHRVGAGQRWRPRSATSTPTLATVIVAGGATDEGVLGYDDLLAEEGEPAAPVDIPERLARADHVHLGHDRAAQGRGAHAHQPRRPGDDVPVHQRRRPQQRRRVHRRPAVPHRRHRQHDHRAAARHADGGLPARRLRSRRAARRPRGREGDRHLPGARAVAGGVRRTAARNPRNLQLRVLSWGAAPGIGHAAAQHVRDLPRHPDPRGVRPDRDVAGDVHAVGRRRNSQTRLGRQGHSDGLARASSTTT